MVLTSTAQILSKGVAAARGEAHSLPDRERSDAVLWPEAARIYSNDAIGPDTRGSYKGTGDSRKQRHHAGP
jgi:hypothetical protein